MLSRNRRRRRGTVTRERMKGTQRDQIWQTLLEQLPSLIRALAALIRALTGY